MNSVNHPTDVADGNQQLGASLAGGAPSRQMAMTSPIGGVVSEALPNAEFLVMGCARALVVGLENNVANFLELGRVHGF